MEPVKRLGNFPVEGDGEADGDEYRDRFDWHGDEEKLVFLPFLPVNCW